MKVVQELSKALERLDTARGFMDSEGFLDSETYKDKEFLNNAIELFKIIDETAEILSNLVEE